jgi:biopolymer transport protein ExbB
MLQIILQIADSAIDAIQTIQNTPAALPIVPAAKEQISLLGLIIKGGWLMIPIALLLLLSIYFFIERLITIRKAGIYDENFMNAIRDNILNGNIQGAKSFCKGTSGPIARIIEKGISRIGKPIKDIERSMENVAKLEIYKMERWLNILKIVAGIAPMFGFLGTIAGMMKLFGDIAADNNLSIGTIASGINIKMVTSAAGLMVGIFAYVCYNSLNAMIDRVVNKMENASFEFLDLLQEPTNS